VQHYQNSTTFEGVSDGPLFLAKLPSGKYTIDAAAEGRTSEHIAQVPAKGQTHVYLTWKGSRGKGSAAS